jgi:hypothetical protein
MSNSFNYPRRRGQALGSGTCEVTSLQYIGHTRLRSCMIDMRRLKRLTMALPPEEA